MARYPLSVLAGALLPFAFAPFGYFWIAPLSLAALFYLWCDASPRHGFGLGFAYGCGSFGVGTYWTYIAVREFGEAPIALAGGLTIGLVATLAAFVGVVGWVAARWLRTRGVLAWLGTLPALFVLGEWLRSWLFTGFGWLAAGYSQTGSWLMGYAPLAGIHAMSWAVLFSAGALLTLVFGTNRQRAVALLAVGAVWAVGFAAQSRQWTTPKERELTVALVQGAITQDLKWRPEQLSGTLARYSELTQQSLGADLIVWPEAAIPTLYEFVRGYLDNVQRAAAEQGSTVMLGILRTDPAIANPETFQNILVALTPTPQVYVKRHLVPFGEYFPVPPFIRSWMRLMNLPYTDAVPGAHDQPPLDVVGERIAVTICYEDVFGAEQLGYLPEATLLVNVSNDGWFGDSIAPHQHLQIAQVRAAEAARYLLRATNTGLTAVIDPKGRVVGTAPQFQPSVLAYTVQGFTGATPYARWGNYLVVLTAFAVVLMPAAARALRRPRSRRPPL
jgi:apolipoprotein N-acyltransferase